jgi:hypothetical protein
MTELAQHLTADELEAGLGEILRSPAAAGTVELIVRRPTVDEREVVVEEHLLERDHALANTQAAEMLALAHHYLPTAASSVRSIASRRSE